MKIVALILYFTILGIIACESNTNNRIRPNTKDSSSALAEYAADDEKMNHAKAEAKKTFSEFVEILKKGCNDCERFTVKVRFDRENGNSEHIWLEDPHFKGSRFLGIIANEPENIAGVRYGDTVEIRDDIISDWFYIKSGKLVGGYTIRVVYNDLNSEERQELEEDFGAKIE